jgi:N6-adenosine-specific RNA methylase IME4
VKADEVMHVRLEAKAIEAVARVAQNLDLEIQAHKLRTRAEARLGEMLEQGEREGVIARHGGHKPKEGSDTEPSSRPATLKEIGVDKKLSSQARKLSGIGQQAVDKILERFEKESRSRGRLAVDVINSETAKRNADSRRQLARELSDCAALSPTGRKFAVLYADPAWQRKAGIGDRAYENTYPTMTWAELLAMPVKDRLLPDAWGFIWIPRAHLLALVEVGIPTAAGEIKVKMPLAWALARAWGFDSYSTCFVWTKTDDDAPDDHGLGLIAWDQDEILLVFKRGRGLPKPDTDKKYGSNHRERAGRHSEKPAFYRQMINDMTGGVQVLELFAREDDEHVLPENFYTWGNQSKNTAEIECDEPFDSSTGEIIPSGVVLHTVDTTKAAAASSRDVIENEADIPTSASSESAIAAPDTHPAVVADSTIFPDIPDFLRRNADNSVPSVPVASPREAQSGISGEAGG